MSALGIYAVAGGLFLVAAWAGRLDVDAGGYDDHFFEGHLRQRGDVWYTVHRLAHDKLEHAVIALCLTTLATLVSGRPLASAVITVALGIGWEIMQAVPRKGFKLTSAGPKEVKRYGFASWRDVVADAVGAAAGALLGVGILALAGR